MEPANNSRKRQIITTLAVLIVIVAIVAAVTVTNKKDSNANSSNSSATTTSRQDIAASDAASSSSATQSSTSDSASATSTTSTYKDGTYTAAGSYNSPGGTESITITVTLANDVITSTSAKSGASDPEAREYQSDFISAYKSLVVGKSIDSISLSRVSGSSLTSQGFNNAIQKIESQAKV